MSDILEDGLHEVYVNASFNDVSKIARLLQRNRGQRPRISRVQQKEELIEDTILFFE